MVASRIKVMLSSTIIDLIDERDQIMSRLESTGLVEVVGATPARLPSRSGSSFIETTDLATDCDLYVLVLAERYGFVTGLGKSATEVEYEAAYRADPTKVLILRKEGVTHDPKQADFIKRVEDYHHGYYVHRFKTPDEGGDVALDAFLHWLRDRSAIGRRLDYFDHFIRIACQRSPFPGAKADYRTTADRLELSFTVINKVYSVHYDKTAIYADFWGSVFDLERRFDDWRKSNFS
ncbi:DUF4062 domain-containing protein [Nocardia niigatensis]